jgi:hypothetical protein
MHLLISSIHVFSALLLHFHCHQMEVEHQVARLLVELSQSQVYTLHYIVSVQHNKFVLQKLRMNRALSWQMYVSLHAYEVLIHT